MPALHPILPPLAILIGAATLTFAMYRVTPLTWYLRSHVGRYGVLYFACFLAMGHAFLWSPMAREMTGNAHRTLFIDLILIGLGAGFLLTGLRLLIRRDEEQQGEE